MKIFDWVHRRVLPNKEYCRVPHHKKDPYVGDCRSEDHHGGNKKAESMEKEALLMDLHHVTSIHHVLDEILTIGTLGHLDYPCQQQRVLDASPLHHQETSKEESAEAEEAKEKEPTVPELPAASAALPNRSMAATESFKRETLEMLDVKINGSADNIADEEGDLLEPLLKAIKDNRRERITLADLFLLASDDNPSNKADPAALQAAASASAQISLEKAATATAAMETKAKLASPRAKLQGGKSLTKKHAPGKKPKGGEDSPHATKKINRMISRMLKKKIHPEMAHDVNSMQACNPSKISSESASLI